MTEATLPPEFAELTPFLDWALPTADERQSRRRRATPAELRSLYDAMLPRIEEILAEVDRFPIGNLPESHHAIYNMALSLAEIAPHIELYKGAVDVPYAFEETRFVAVHGDHATWQGRQPMGAF